MVTPVVRTFQQFRGGRLSIRSGNGVIRASMTNTLAIFLGLVIVAFFTLDHFVLHWNAPMIALRILVDLIDRLAFWR